MNCREFETSWNEWLDAHAADSSGLEPAMEAHASTCDHCRTLSSGYQVLRQAIAAWPSVPQPSAASIERLYQLTVPSATLVIRHRRRKVLARLIPIASAAAVLGLVWVGWSGHLAGPRPENPNQVPVAVGNPATQPRPDDSMTIGPLKTVLAEAREATIDLAVETSGPAARIGRELFDLDNFQASAATEEPEVLAEGDSSAANLLQNVGRKVNASVKPISGSARTAFSFLFVPPPSSDPATARPQDSF